MGQRDARQRRLNDADGEIRNSEMIRSGGGSIINLSSVAGLSGGHPSLLYPTSKGAIVSLTRAMAAHHGPRRHPCQLHRAGHGLHADGGIARHDGGVAEGPQRRHAAR